MAVSHVALLRFRRPLARTRGRLSWSLGMVLEGRASSCQPEGRRPRVLPNGLVRFTCRPSASRIPACRALAAASLGRAPFCNQRGGVRLATASEGRGNMGEEPVGFVRWAALHPPAQSLRVGTQRLKPPPCGAASDTGGRHPLARPASAGGGPGRRPLGAGTIGPAAGGGGGGLGVPGVPR